MAAGAWGGWHGGISIRTIVLDIVKSREQRPARVPLLNGQRSCMACAEGQLPRRYWEFPLQASPHGENAIGMVDYGCSMSRYIFYLWDPNQPK